MAKRENWFKHDIDSRLGLRMAAFIDEFGLWGYGLFWVIVETLYRTDGHRLAKASIIWQTLAKGSTAKQVVAAIDSATKLGLFASDENWFWSPRVLAEIAEIDKHYQRISEVKSQAGKLGGLAKASKASQRRVDEIRLDKSNINITPISGNGLNHPETKPKTPRQKPVFDPGGKNKYGDWVYLSPEQFERVKAYYSARGLDKDLFEEAVRELDNWFSNNPKMRAKRTDDAKALMGWPLNNAIKRKRELIYLDKATRGD